MKKKLLIVVGVLVALFGVSAGGMAVWATSGASAKLSQTFDTHVVELQMPPPLAEADIIALKKAKTAELEKAGKPLTQEDGTAVDVLAGVDLKALAQKKSVERGKHLVEARYACIECHGANFAGGVMIDDAAMGTILGPNITAGAGSVVTDYKASDWDRIVRHGVKPDGTAALMPSEDFIRMSDNELSDIIAYVKTAPPVDNNVAPPSLGPLGTVLMAAGQFPLSADLLHDHQAAHKVLPPKAEATAEFGAHLAAVCTGCHRPELNGGPIPIGPPDWPAAGNLTPGPDGLQGWTFAQFDTAMRTGKKADGTSFVAPMTLITPYMAKTTDVEMKALWAYLQSIKALPDGT